MDRTNWKQEYAKEEKLIDELRKENEMLQLVLNRAIDDLINNCIFVNSTPTDVLEYYIEKIKDGEECSVEELLKGE